MNTSERSLREDFLKTMSELRSRSISQIRSFSLSENLSICGWPPLYIYDMTEIEVLVISIFRRFLIAVNREGHRRNGAIG